MRRSLPSAILLAVACCGLPACAPRAPDQAPAEQRRRRPRSVPGWAMWLYKHYLAQVDAHRTCRFRPTCGDYARQAIRKHGPLLGWVMGCERAIRYHGDTGTYRRTLEGETRLVDEVEDNDFWFAAPFRRTQP
ncbi:MAG: membrane protein insertion efficiency factor YidD [Candidatus Brocadiia bacterium]